jgi:hypothetical protein
MTAPLPELLVPLIEQIGDEWCWAACAQMALRYYKDLGTRQCDLAHDFLGLVIDCCTPGLPPFDCDKPCKPKDVAGIYSGRGLSASRLNGVATFSEIEDEIANRRPVEIALQKDSSTGHLIIVKWAGTELGEEWVKTNDPYPEESLLLYTELLNQNAFDSWTGIE